LAKKTSPKRKTSRKYGGKAKTLKAYPDGRVEMLAFQITPSLPNGTQQNPTNFSGSPLTTTMQGTIDSMPNHMAYNVDGRQDVALSQPTGSTSPFTWSAQLPGSSCTPTNSWHTIMIFAWGPGPSCTTVAYTFYRGT
jgi:hypothetical protein